jgi:hypothetical protein
MNKEGNTKSRIENGERRDTPWRVLKTMRRNTMNEEGKDSAKERQTPNSTPTSSLSA